MGTIIKNTTSAFVDGQQITSDALNNLIDDAILNTTAVSAGTGLTVNASTGVLSMDTSLTGKTLTGGSLNNCPIGASTPSTGAFTTLTASGDANFDSGTLFVDASTDCVGIGTTAAIDTQIGGNAKLGAYDASGARVGIWGNGSRWWYLHGEDSNAFQIGFRGSSNTTDNDVITALTSGNVGIGTTSPSEKLHVKSSNSDTAEAVAGFGNGDIDVGLQIKTNGNGGSSLDWGFNAVNSRNLVFDTNQNERMRITSTGNVGIGDNDPSKELVVKQISSAGSESIINIIAGNAGVAGVYFGDSDDDIVGGIVYDNSADTLQLRSSDNHTAVTINSSEQVGIGTSPSHKLDVNSGATNQVALFESTDATAYIELADNTGSAQLITPENGALRIATGGAGAGSVGTSGLFIDQSQNVGIGDDTPSYKLDVNGDFRATGALRDSAGDAGTSGQILSSTGTGTNWINASSGGSSPWTTSGSDIYYNTGSVGINDSTPSYKLDVNGTGRFVNDLTLDEELIHNLGGDGALPGYSANGGSSHGTRGCVIEDGGVNGSTIYVARRNQWALHLASDTGSQGSPATVVRFADMDEQGSDGAGLVGSITITPSATAYNTSSDYRLKENVVAITDGIDRLKQLSPYRFNFINTPDTTVDGFFAHEVSPVVPESIAGSKDAVDDDGNPVYQGIDQSKLVPLLTAALQEAVAKIEALEARVQTLEG